MKHDFMNVPHADTPTYERSNTSDVRRERHYFGRHSTFSNISIMRDAIDTFRRVAASRSMRRYWAR
jgi:hypothetical protein